jgi:hypothetical protein
LIDNVEEEMKIMGIHCGGIECDSGTNGKIKKIIEKAKTHPGL